MRRDYTSLEEAIQYGEGVERPFVCHMHDTTSITASVNVEKGVWYCFSCQHAGRVDRKSATLTSEMKATLAAFEQASEPVRRPLGWLDVFDADTTHPYWEERFGTDICRKYRLGIHPLTGNPTYPMIGPDKLVHGVVQRTFGIPKYLYPAGVSVSRMLFGYTKRKVRTVLVVEGAADAIAVSEALGTMRTLMVVGCYGAGLHAPQVSLINSIGPMAVLLGFDDDEAGQRAKGKAYELSAPFVNTITWGRKDPGECTPEGIRSAVRRSSDEQASRK